MLNKKPRFQCANDDCKKTFDNPKTITYYACPFCSNKIKDINKDTGGCLYYFGYLGMRKQGEIIPAECVECQKSIECMLKRTNSKEAAEEIQKWYK